MTPFLVTPGKPTETRSNLPSALASLRMMASTWRGVAPLGVGMRARSVSGRPRSSSNSVLIPVPPISTASVRGPSLLGLGAELDGLLDGLDNAFGFSIVDSSRAIPPPSPARRQWIRCEGGVSRQGTGEALWKTEKNRRPRGGGGSTLYDQTISATLRRRSFCCARRSWPVPDR